MPKFAAYAKAVLVARRLQKSALPPSLHPQIASRNRTRSPELNGSSRNLGIEVARSNGQALLLRRRIPTNRHAEVDQNEVLTAKLQEMFLLGEDASTRRVGTPRPDAFELSAFDFDS